MPPEPATAEKPPNPFTQNVLSRESKSLWEMMKRRREGARAKAASDAIDKQLKQDLEMHRRERETKILLLGQSGSGQSASSPSREVFLSLPNSHPQESPP